MQSMLRHGCLTVITLVLAGLGPCPLAVHGEDPNDSELARLVAFPRGGRRGEEMLRDSRAWPIRKGITEQYGHCRIEIFETSAWESVENEIWFSYVVSEFRQAFKDNQGNIGYPLHSVVMNTVILDGFGAPVAQQTIKFIPGSDDEFTLKVEQGDLSPAAYVRNWPTSAQTTLHLATGFLQRNPGSEVVHFAKTREERVVDFWATLITLTPGVGKGALSRAAGVTLTKGAEFAIDQVEKLGKRELAERFRQSFRNKTLRYGVADFPTADAMNDKDARAFFTDIGRDVWGSYR